MDLYFISHVFVGFVWSDGSKLEKSNGDPSDHTKTTQLEKSNGDPSDHTKPTQLEKSNGDPSDHTKPSKLEKSNGDPSDHKALYGQMDLHLISQVV
jgi:hypothetical protein